MTADQRAMAVAIIYPEPAQLKKRAGSPVAGHHEVSESRLVARPGGAGLYALAGLAAEGPGGLHLAFDDRKL